MQINYGRRTLERIYQLHSAAINCIIASEGFAVTGSDDNYVRVWPLDFADFLLEVSPDWLSWARRGAARPVLLGVMGAAFF